MTLKQFLKPEWKKVIITIIISIVSILLWVFYYNNNTCACFCILVVGAPCPPCDCPPKISNLVVLPSFPLLTLQIGKGNDVLSNYMGTADWMFVIITSIIYWYLLSCLIIWIYDKVKKK